MYIRLTKLDGSPIWLNAAFIVTIEPARNGGATVVPIGDGLDYDVRENPEKVLSLLDGAPSAAVVPVPPPPGLVKTPWWKKEPTGEKKPEPGPIAQPSPTSDAKKQATPIETPTPVPESQLLPKAAEKAKPAKTDKSHAAEDEIPLVEESGVKPPRRTRKTTRTKKSAATTDAAAGAAKPADAPSEPSSSAAEPVKRSRGRPKKKVSDTVATAPVPEVDADTQEAIPAGPAATPATEPFELTDEQVVRLGKMMPGSMRKLNNTLYTQFHVNNLASTVAELEARGIIAIEGERIRWTGSI